MKNIFGFEVPVIDPNGETCEYYGKHYRLFDWEDDQASFTDDEGKTHAVGL